MSRACLRVLPLAAVAWGLLGPGGCYRAEIDIAQPASASASSDAGAAGASCDATPLSSADDDCRNSFLPDNEQCSVQDPNGWNGCYNGGCSVCADVTREFPFYFLWHPCCQPNTVCTSDLRVKCNERCPPPVDHDRVMPCAMKMLNY